ncbi:hypothetical protein Tco_1013250 [Tanacetum coccineum]
MMRGKGSNPKPNNLTSGSRNTSKKVGISITLIRLIFGDDTGGKKEKVNDDGVGGSKDEDLHKPFKEVLRRSHQSVRRSRKLGRMVGARMVQNVSSDIRWSGHELLRGEFLDKGQKSNYQNDRPTSSGYGGYRHRHNYQNDHQARKPHAPYVPPWVDNRRHEIRRDDVPRLNLESLMKFPKEILSMELHSSCLLAPPMVGVPRRENMDQYCDCHGEIHGDIRKSMAQGEKDWLNVSIAFPPVSYDDASDEQLIVEAEVEGYLILSHRDPDCSGRILKRRINPGGEDVVESVVRK